MDGSYRRDGSTYVTEFIYVHMVRSDPLREYQSEGFAMFEEMVLAIENDAARFAMKAEIRNNLRT